MINKSNEYDFVVTAFDVAESDVVEDRLKFHAPTETEAIRMMKADAIDKHPGMEFKYRLVAINDHFIGSKLPPYSGEFNRSSRSAEKPAVAGPLSEAFAHRSISVDGEKQDFKRLKVAADADTARAMISAWKAKQRKAETGLEWKVILKVHEHPSGKAIIYAKGGGRDVKKVNLVKPRVKNGAIADKPKPGDYTVAFSTMMDKYQVWVVEEPNMEPVGLGNYHFGDFKTLKEAHDAIKNKEGKWPTVWEYTPKGTFLVVMSKKRKAKNASGYKAESRGFTIKMKPAWKGSELEIYKGLQGEYVNPGDWDDDYVVGIVEGDVPKTEAEFEATIRKQVAKLDPKYQKLVKSIHIDE